MFRRIEFSNLKAFSGDHSVDLAPLTLIYGRNSAGKSSLLQALLLLKQTIESSDPERPALVIRGPLADLGSVPGIISGHDTDLELKLGAEVDAKDHFGRATSEIYGVNLSFQWDQEVRSVRQTGIDVSLDNGLVAAYTRRREPASARVETPFQIGRRDARETFLRWILSELAAQPRYRLRPGSDARALLDDIEDLVDVFTERAMLTSASWGILPHGPSFVLKEPISQKDEGYKTVLGECEDLWWDVLSSLRFELAGALESLIYLGPLRRAPERFHVLSGARRRSVGREGEYTAEILNQNPALTTEVNKWLGRLEVPYTLTVIGVQESEVASTIGDVVVLALTDTRSGLQVSPGDVGFGISQLLPIVVQAIGGTNSTICVEQPEIHVHPHLQGHIADLLIEAALKGPKNQLVVETHSEHIMLRIQSRLRAKEIKPDEIKVLYIDTDEDGLARIVPLSLDEHGGFIDEWPEGFFEERFHEIFG
ncbi:MAG: DUF3696 domain-containing protein [Actinobacteria bacterium]|nr:MAG: DUF3696 domain-containing protein [Actinomycetota bacterium]